MVPQKLAMKNPKSDGSSLEKYFAKSALSLRETLTKYLDDLDEKNAHDARTTIRRLEASYLLLPKKIRQKRKVSEYLELCRQFFRANTNIRDSDIVGKKITAYLSGSTQSDILSAISRKRTSGLAATRKLGKELWEIDPQVLPENGISNAQIKKRFHKVMTGLARSIRKDFSVALSDKSRVEKLHRVRKEAKMLRYVLEIASPKNTSNLISELTKLQDVLGEIRDLDITLEYLQSVKRSEEIRNVIEKAAVDRDERFSDFARAWKGGLSLPA